MSNVSNGVLGFELRIDPANLTKSELTGVRMAIAVNGAVAIVLGIMVLVWPSATVSLVAILVGLYFLVSGAIRLGRGIFMRGATVGGRILGILLGVLLVVTGIVAIRNPLNTLVVLALVIGISWIVEGVGAIVETAPDSSKWFGTIFAASPSWRSSPASSWFCPGSCRWFRRSAWGDRGSRHPPPAEIRDPPTDRFH